MRCPDRLLSWCKPHSRVVGIHAYAYAVFLLVSLLFAGGGEGSYVSVAVLWGWAAVPFSLHPSFFSWFLPPLVEIVLYCMLWILAYLGRIPTRILLLLPIAHALGALIAWETIRDKLGERVGSLGWPFWAACSTSGLLILVYWLAYFRGLKGLGERGAPKNE